MNTRESIEKAIREHRALKADDERPALGREAYVPALAEHLAKELPPTVDELLEVFRKYNHQNSEAWSLRVRVDGSGSVRDSDDSPLLYWERRSSGKTIIKAIKAAMPPEPTAKEKALAALDQIVNDLSIVGPLGDIYKQIETIRKALEAKGCES